MLGAGFRWKEHMLRTHWQDIPFAPRRVPFFYGWVIVAAATIGTLASIPGQTMGVGVFTDDLMRVLGLDRVRLSTAYAIGTIASSFLLPLAGQFLDRVGSRVVVVLSALGLGISMIFLSQCDRLIGHAGPGSFYAAMLVACASFMLIRFFGQGCLTVASRVAIGKWFNHRRGLAVAVSSVFVAFGFNGSPRVLNDLVAAFGWRATCLILAATVGVGMTVIGWIFYRDNPEQCGLVMDGVTDEAWHRKMEARVPDVHKEFTRGEAVRTLAFWVFGLATAAQSLIITAVAFHIASLGEDLGLSRNVSYAVFLPMSYFGVASNFIGGWLSDRIHLKWLLLVMMAAQVAMVVGLMRFDEESSRRLLIVGGGVSGGLFGTLVTVAWPRFFGREHLGAISGLHMSIMVFASAIGPILFAEGKAITGSYRAVEILCLAAPASIFLLGLVVRNPQERLHATHES